MNVIKKSYLFIALIATQYCHGGLLELEKAIQESDEIAVLSNLPIEAMSDIEKTNISQLAVQIVDVRKKIAEDQNVSDLPVYQQLSKTRKMNAHKSSLPNITTYIGIAQAIAACYFIERAISAKDDFHLLAWGTGALWIAAGAMVTLREAYFKAREEQAKLDDRLFAARKICEMLKQA